MPDGYPKISVTQISVSPVYKTDIFRATINYVIATPIDDHEHKIFCTTTGEGLSKYHALATAKESTMLDILGRNVGKDAMGKFLNALAGKNGESAYNDRTAD